MATKNTSSKKKTVKKPSSTNKRSVEKKTAPKNEFKSTNEKINVSYLVWVILFAFFGITIFLSIIVALVSRLTGETALLGYLTEPFLGLWGICTPIVGIYCLVFSYFCYKYKDSPSVKTAKGALLVLNIILLLGVFHLIYTHWVDIPVGMKSFWRNGVNWRGAGVIGGCFGQFLSLLLHKSVGLIVGTILYIVCLTFFCGSTPIQVIKLIKQQFRLLVAYISRSTKQAFESDTDEEFEQNAFESVDKDTKLKKEILPKQAKKEDIIPSVTKDEKVVPADAPSVPEPPSDDKNEPNNEPKEEPKDEPQDEIKDEPKVEKKATNPTLYVTDSIYDAPLNTYPKTATDSNDEDTTPPWEDKEPTENDAQEPKKNKFGFKYGREARNENGEIPEDEDISEEIESSVGDDIDEIEGEEREIVPGGEDDAPAYIFPPVDLLERGMEETTFNAGEVEQKKRILLATLEAFKVKADVVNISCGPTITRYEIEPEMGVSVKSIEKLGKDLALRLAAKSLRIEAPIPGKCAVGIEVSNNDRLTVKLRDILDSPVFRDNKSKLFCCLGVDVAGNAIYLDIAKMPHLLIAGATGMGKSVCLNCLIISLLYRATPQDVRLILIDPKKVEFSHYADLPHLLAPVVTNINKCAGTLNWAVAEMERRYDIFEANSLRNLQEYQAKTADDPESEKLASIVIVIDELADLMMQAGAEVENSICRLAQKARAAGMYLILGTQRPSVDVITGLIKANIPSRIALAVTSQVDSRTILDTAGAENLLDKGDILFAPAGARKALRVQGAFVSTKELNTICDFVRQNSASHYDENVISRINEEAEQCGRNKKGKAAVEGVEKAETDTKDVELMIAALDVGFEQGTISTSYIQRRLSFGYAKAARVVDLLQQHGFVSAPDPVNKLRKIIISPQEFAELKLNRSIDTKSGGTE